MRLFNHPFDLFMISRFLHDQQSGSFFGSFLFFLGRLDEASLTEFKETKKGD